MKALLRLSSDRTYEDFELYSALEPCHLCLSATIIVRIGTLRYAVADAYGGAAESSFRVVITTRIRCASSDSSTPRSDACRSSFS